MHKQITTGYESLVQPIAVTTAGHLDMCQAAALASAQVLGYILEIPTPEDPWQRASQLEYDRIKIWLDHSMTKRVARISKPSQLQRLQKAIQYHNLIAAEATSGDATAIALTPMHPSEIPREMRSLQVSNTQGDRTIIPEHFSVTGPHIRISPEIKMSTGKTAAQVAHATTLYLMEMYPIARRRWLTKPTIAVSRRQENRRNILTVRDNGKTEIEPGTITATVNRP